MSTIYTTPKVCKSKSGWYVYFRYNGVQKRYKKGLNYIQDLRQRTKEANVLKRVLLQKLKGGWNPLGESILDDEILFLDALQFALEKKKANLSNKTYLGYRGTLNFVIKSTQGECLDYLAMKDVKRSHIRIVMDRIKNERVWSNKAYNKNLNYLKAILSELLDWDVIETNPAHGIKNLKESVTTANVPATIEQHKIIKHHLSENHPNFLRFIQTIYHTGIRPKEILSIKIGMLDLNNDRIVLPANITKTDIDRIVPINPHLKRIFLDMEVGMYPKDFYLFGSFRQSGKGNIGKHLDFICGTTPIKRDTATRRWKRIVKDGLGIDVTMYSNKHGGANAKILAGIDLDALRELYGHTSKLTTVTYAKVVKDVYRNQIIDKSPDY